MGKGKISVENVDSVGQSLPFPSNFRQDLNHPTDNCRSFFPVKIHLISKVTVKIFALNILKILIQHVIQ